MDISSPNACSSSIKFLKWQTLYEKERPFQIFTDIPEAAADQRLTNLVYEDIKQTFHNIRGRETCFHLDDHGFTYRRHQIDFEDFESRKAVEAEYLPQIEKLFKKCVDEVDKVFIFDWRLRKSGTFDSGPRIDLNNLTAWLRPALHVHVDQAPAAVLNRILMQLPDEADVLLKGRVRVINAWRPLKAPVEDWPIAVCDGSKISPRHLVETDHVRRTYTGSNLNAIYTPDFRWYYLNQQDKDEILVFKNFDSSDTVRAKYCPHVSFHHPNVGSDICTRESIEVRALIFTSKE